MTIEQAIAHVDYVRPNQYSHETKVGWLSKLDGMIWREVFRTHKDNPYEEFTGYDAATPDTELLVPYPYDEDVYNYFLQSQIDKENGEVQKYNQSITLYNNSFQIFWAYWNRTHVPLPEQSAFRF